MITSFVILIRPMSADYVYVGVSPFLSVLLEMRIPFIALPPYFSNPTFSGRFFCHSTSFLTVHWFSISLSPNLFYFYRVSSSKWEGIIAFRTLLFFIFFRHIPVPLRRPCRHTPYVFIGVSSLYYSLCYIKRKVETFFVFLFPFRTFIIAQIFHLSIVFWKIFWKILNFFCEYRAKPLF